MIVERVQMKKKKTPSIQDVKIKRTYCMRLQTIASGLTQHRTNSSQRKTRSNSRNQKGKRGGGDSREKAKEKQKFLGKKKSTQREQKTLVFQHEWDN